MFYVSWAEMMSPFMWLRVWRELMLIPVSCGRIAAHNASIFQRRRKSR